MQTLLKNFCKLKVNYYFCSIIKTSSKMETQTQSEWVRASMKFIFSFEGDIWKENARNHISNR